MAVLGAIPVTLSYNQVLPALQADLVDGAENNWPSYITTDHHRAAPYLTLTEHVRPPEVVVVSRQIWDGLSASDRDVLREAALTSRNFHRLRFAEWTTISVEQARAEGVQIIEEFDKGSFELIWSSVRQQAIEDEEMCVLAKQVRDLT